MILCHQGFDSCHIFIIEWPLSVSLCASHNGIIFSVCASPATIWYVHVRMTSSYDLITSSHLEFVHFWRELLFYFILFIFLWGVSQNILCEAGGEQWQTKQNKQQVARDCCKVKIYTGYHPTHSPRYDYYIFLFSIFNYYFYRGSISLRRVFTQESQSRWRR